MKVGQSEDHLWDYGVVNYVSVLEGFGILILLGCFLLVWELEAAHALFVSLNWSKG